MSRKGDPKTPGSGRRKGSLSWQTRYVLDVLNKFQCDPIEGMIRIAQNPLAPLELRGRMFSELAQYIFPKRKAVEHSGGQEHNLVITVRRLDQLQKLTSNGSEIISVETETDEP